MILWRYFILVEIVHIAGTTLYLVIGKYTHAIFCCRFIFILRLHSGFNERNVFAHLRFSHIVIIPRSLCNATFPWKHEPLAVVCSCLYTQLSSCVPKCVLSFLILSCSQLLCLNISFPTIFTIYRQTDYHRTVFPVGYSVSIKRSTKKDTDERNKKKLKKFFFVNRKAENEVKIKRKFFNTQWGRKKRHKQ